MDRIAREVELSAVDELGHNESDTLAFLIPSRKLYKPS